MNQDRSIYDNLADQFDQHWQAGERPALQDYLDQVDISERQILAEMLLSIEIEYRQSKGESVSVADYQQQGKVIREVATKLLSDDQIEFSQTNLSPPLSQQLEIGETRTLPPDNQQKSRTIDRYKLLQKLGEGGMGTVWMAEQQHPVRRRVALKLIKGGADNREIIARFEAERQALAMMDHPNIAKVLDAGATEDGLPYFVMELVQGIAINEYCDRNKLSPKRRMELFVPACKAVQHAHQKGIIHRDLKPSNVLVAIYDGKPVAKVIDFGLAKALQHQTQLTDKTMFTQFGQVVGTPQYMSPEQATMDAMSVDTRSDVYSLGVMLYELLAGSTPIDKEMLKEHALLKVLEMIREQEPPRPSLRVSTAGDQIQTIGEHRQIQPLKLQQILRGDLDWIVMKAIEKDCSRRYETASGLADDIERYLRGDAIEARPPSTAYRLSKFISKNRRLAAMAAAVFLLLAAGVVGTSIGLFRAQAAREIADRKTEIANQKTDELAVEKERADLEKTHAQQSAKQARDAELAAVEAQNKTESTLARSNYFLANARWEQQRVGEARQTLNRVPLKHRNFEWYLSQQQFLGSAVTCYHHADEVISVAFSANGTRLITGSKDNTIKIVDLASGDPVKTIKHRAKKISLSPDGKLLATCNYANSLSIVDVETGDEVKTFEDENSSFQCPAFSPDGSKIATTSADNDILIRECSTGKELKTLAGHEKRIACLAFSPDGKRLVSGANNVIKIWDLQTGDELEKLKGGFTSIKDLAFSLDGAKLACRSYNQITIRDSKTGNVLQTIATDPNVGVDKVALSADGSVVAGNFGAKIIMWDAATGNERQTLVGHSFGLIGPVAVQSLAFSPDGTKLVSGGADNTVKIWPISSEEGNTLLSGISVSIPALSPDGKSFVCAVGRKIGVYDSVDGSELKSFACDSAVCARPAFSPDGKRVAIACRDKGIRIWDLENQCDLATLTGHTGEIFDLAFSPDGTKLASGSGDKTAKLWNALDGTELNTFTGFTQRLASVAFSPDGTRLATGSFDGSIKIRDVATGKELQALDMRIASVPSLIMCVTFSPDGSQLAAGGHEVAGRGDIRTWDVESGALLNKFVGHKQHVSSIAFSLDGTRLASGSHDKAIKLWDTATGSELKTITGHQHEVGSVTFSPDNTKLFSSDRQAVKIWDAGNAFKTLPKSSSIYQVGFSQDSARVVGNDFKGNVIQWDLATGAQLSEVIKPENMTSEYMVDPENRISADERWLVAKTGSDILLLDLEYRNSPEAKSYRKFKTSLKHHQHARLALEAYARQDWFAAVFHRAWEMKGDPYKGNSKLRLAIAKLKENAPQAESSMQMPPVVSEMLKRKPVRRPASAGSAQYSRDSLWKQVKSPIDDTSDDTLNYDLKYLREWSKLHSQGFAWATLSAAEFRMENYESAIADALKSLQRSRLKFKPAQYHGCSLAVLAMSHHKLGNQAEASNFRKQLNDIMKNDEFKDDQDSKSFLLEVNKLFDAKLQPE